MNPWHDMAPSRVTPERFLAVIGIPRGSKKKYELDKETSLIRLDRILFISTHYPSDCGFVPLTWADDNDPLDVLVLCPEISHFFEVSKELEHSKTSVKIIMDRDHALAIIQKSLDRYRVEFPAKSEVTGQS